MLRDYLVLVAGVFAIGLSIYGVWWLYDLGKLHGVVELESLRSGHATLQEQNLRLLRENKSLTSRVAVFERSAEIDRQAIADVRNDLAGLEQELQAAREEVEFYRGIVSPGTVQSGLRIHRFKLKQDALPGRYVYNLVLTQLTQKNRPVSGMVDWTISGLMLGEPGELALAGVTRPSVQQLKFRFRYFQALSGVITLPEGFEATYVTLTVTPAGKGGQQAVEQVFDWPEAAY
ncbi:MAG: DUF6776 family protein [Gammaproteobacteria bacterium]|jgi:hypothetical protein